MRLLVAVSCAATLACSKAEDGPPMLGEIRDLCDSESVSIAPAGLAFGRLIPGTARVRTATLTYEGCSHASLELASDGLLDPECDRGAFCFVEAPKLELEPGESSAITIEFHPSNTGIAVGGLTVSGCPTGRCKAELLVQGSAQENGLVCYPDPVDFGVIGAGQCAGRRINCTNVVDRAIEISSVALAPESSPALRASATTPATIAPEDSLAIDLDYCPAEDGQDEGTAIIVSSVEGHTASVAIDLRARSGGGRLDMPEAIDFGMVSLIAPARRPLRVTNTGEHRLEVFGVDTDPPFTAVLSSGASLAPNESANLWLQVEPTAEGTVQGFVQIYSDDPFAPMRTVRATVEGTNLPPCLMRFSEEELDFGMVPVGDVAVRELGVENEGSLDCVVTAASVVEIDTAFSVPESRSIVIDSGSSASIAVKFTPTGTIAPSAATLEVGISSPASPYRRVPLFGRGQ